MHPDSAVSHVVFGWNALWVATPLFVLTYIVVMSDKVNRAIVGLLGAGVMILAGVLTQEAAIRGIDFNTIGLLAGMMIIVAITRRSGVFQYVAIWAAKLVKAEPWRVLVMMALVTAVFSAFLDNVTTVLLTLPVTLLITQDLRVKPYPYLVAVIFSSNIGGTATLIGDPPNIMIGSGVGISFNEFVVNLAPVCAVVLLATLVPIRFLWRKEFHAAPEDRQRVMNLAEHEAIKDPRLLKQALSVLAVVIGCFVFARQIHLEPATIAMFGAALLLLLDNLGKPSEEQSSEVHRAFTEVEWVTLMFFLGLFIVVAGVEQAGLLDILARKLLAATGGDLKATTLAILWASAVLSALVDNIPFVAAMIPLIKSMAPAFGGAEHLMPLWWALSLGACLGGNGTLVGASANLIVAGIAEREGHPIKFVPYMKVGFPMMLLSIVICTAYIYLRYL